MAYRLDVLLYERGLAESREKARALILAGKVLVYGERVDKPGRKVPEDAHIQLTDPGKGFVSRGGDKLQGAIEAMKLDFKGKTVIDVGASTGGFTDCALSHGAAHVIAVDVGYGQLDWRLRQDERVTVMERVNIRYLTLEHLPFKPDMATIDVSFISLLLVLPIVAGLIDEEGEIVALVKPQFEAGRDQVGKNGVVRDPAIHAEVLRRILNASASMGIKPVNACYSPITGPKGNIEYFIHFKKQTDVVYDADNVYSLVNEANNRLRS